MFGECVRLFVALLESMYLGSVWCLYFTYRAYYVADHVELHSVFHCGVIYVFDFVTSHVGQCL